MSKYTQRQWDRTVGWGSVPDEYKEEEMKPNTQFELSVKDIALIEKALRESEQTRETQELLGKIHNQKNWHRPRNKIYVSG
tara:strand:- start:8252 stop:8494 length:243 start_codon:yes stop_codon:yes gene_type:complete